MMRFSMTFLEAEYSQLLNELQRVPGVENAAYLLCRMSTNTDDTRLLVREVIPVEQEDILEASAHHMKIANASFRRAMKRANDRKSAFVFVHSHPDGVRRQIN